MQGAATPSSRSRSPENSTSGSQTPVIAGADEPSDSIDAPGKDKGFTFQSASDSGQLENKDDQFGDFTSGGSSGVVPDPEQPVSGNVPSKDSVSLSQTGESLETHDIASRTRHDSFGDFSSGPTVVQGTDSLQKSAQGTTEILHKNIDNNVKVTSNVDNLKTFHSEDEDDESSLGKPEPPAFPDHDHDDEDDDEFGDFGTVSKSSDDFGDFGDFKSTFSNKSEQHASVSSKLNISNNTKTADDFGGFESGPSMPQTRNMSSTKTDDFGNFGAFQDSKAKDSGEDDFGDFGTFESEKKQEVSSGFASFQSSSSTKWDTSTKLTQVGEGHQFPLVIFLPVLSHCYYFSQYFEGPFGLMNREKKSCHNFLWFLICSATYISYCRD